MPILVIKDFPISDALADIIQIISAEYGNQILVAKIFMGGRISHILTNFIQDIRVINKLSFTGQTP